MQEQLHNKSVDGLRGLAALNVVVSHFVIAYFPSLLAHNYPDMFAENTQPGFLFTLVSSPLASLFYNGLFPVILFFTLSGYVLARPYYFNRHTDLQKRFMGRYLRLNIPIAVSVILAFILLQTQAFSNQAFSSAMGETNRMKNYFGETIDVGLVATSATYNSILFGENSLNPPLWSLRVEFIGTMLLLGIYLINPKQFTWLLFIAASIIIYQLTPGDSIFYIAIFTGALLNRLTIARTPALVLSFLGIYLGCFQHGNILYDWLPYCRINNFEIWEIKASYNTLGAICLTSGIVNGAGKKLLESVFVQFLGRISFSIYLLHFLILCSISCGLYFWFPQSTFFVLLNFIIYMGCCVGASVLFWRWIDKPSIVISKKFSQWLLNGITSINRSK